MQTLALPAASGTLRMHHGKDAFPLVAIVMQSGRAVEKGVVISQSSETCTGNSISRQLSPLGSPGRHRQRHGISLALMEAARCWRVPHRACSLCARFV